MTYTDAVLAADLGPEVLAAGTFGYEGDRLPRVPRWTFAGAAGYETAIAADSSLYVQTDFNYRSSSTSSFNDQNAFNTDLPEFFLIGASAGVRIESFDLGVFVTNLTDKVAVYGVDPILDGIRIYSPEPRAFGIRVSARY